VARRDAAPVHGRRPADGRRGTGRDAESDPARQLCQELVVSLSFYATALEVFGPAALDRLIVCLKDRNYAIIDDLAAARYAIRVNAGLAYQLLERYRLQHGMGLGDGVR
jgi:hypothetical protein